MTAEKEVETRRPSLGHTYTLRCNDCETPVNVNCMNRPLTEKEQGELAFRILCNPCLKKRIEAKN